MSTYLSTIETHAHFYEAIKDDYLSDNSPNDIYNLCKQSLNLFDQWLKKPIDVVDTPKRTIVTVFNAVIYDVYQSKQCIYCYLDFHGQSKQKEYVRVKIQPALVTSYWIKTVLNNEFDNQQWSLLNHCSCFSEGFIETLYKILLNDIRFISLKNIEINKALKLPSDLLPLSQFFYDKGFDKSETLSFIWLNIKNYRQLINENHKLTKLLHYAREDIYDAPYFFKPNISLINIKKRKRLKQLSNFDLKALKTIINEEFDSQRAWRYVREFGDNLFHYVWSRKPEYVNHFDVSLSYLSFLKQHDFPAPIDENILQVLFSVQGYDESKAVTFDIVWDGYQKSTFSCIFKHFSRQKSVDESEIDELTNIIYWLVEEHIELDHNQLKQGYHWMVKSFRQWLIDKDIKFKISNTTWPSHLVEFNLDQYVIKEINNHYDLFKIAQKMRNCLENYVDACVDEEVKVFAIYNDVNQRPLAVMSAEKNDEEWYLEDISGFANQRVSDEFWQVSKATIKKLNSVCICLNIEDKQTVVQGQDSILMRNCNFKFQCEQNWETLKLTNLDEVRFCSRCEEHVYFCNSHTQIGEAVQKNNCVAFYDREEQNTSADGPMLIGKMGVAPYAIK